MNQDQSQLLDQAVNRFIDLANELKDAGHDIRMVSVAMTTASSIYATYAEAGNQGFLQPDGVDKLCDLYRKQLEYIQERKKAELKAAGHDVDQPSPKAS